MRFEIKRNAKKTDIEEKGNKLIVLEDAIWILELKREKDGLF